MGGAAYATTAPDWLALGPADFASGLARLHLAIARTVADARPRTLPAGSPAGTRGSAAGPPEQRDTSDPAVDAEQIALIHRAVAGDSQAFGELYDRYVDLVYRYVFYRVGAAALAEDLTSETFLRALKAIGGYRVQGKDFGAWLVTIARNLVADHYKSGRYRLELSTAELADIPSQPVAGPERVVLDSISQAELLNAVRKLNPEQQECIALRFLQGLSVTETAQLMGKREGAIKALQYRAVRSLARHVPAGQW
jgi:RNA polymerase sigma-70 factor (ECF subfamily)